MVWDSCHNRSSRRMHPFTAIQLQIFQLPLLKRGHFWLLSLTYRGNQSEALGSSYQFRRNPRVSFSYPTQRNHVLMETFLSLAWRLNHLLVSGHPILSIPMRMSCKLESVWILPGAVASSNDQVKRICRKLFRVDVQGVPRALTP